MNWYSTWCKLCNLGARVRALELLHPHPAPAPAEIVIWAEEGAAISGNQQEWSFGNAATGQVGIPLLGGWEVIGMTAHFDNFPAGRTVTLSLRDQGPGVDVPGAQLVATSDVATVSYFSPIGLAPGAVIGFRTVSVTGGGGVSDGRVAAWLRRV